jgi:hypothetical protein
MTEPKAAGPKTELIGVSQRMQQSIEDLIASLTEGVGDCLQNARTTEPESGFDDTRSSERRDAVNIASTAAEVLAAIAKLKGGFSHNYHVTRAEERPAAQEHGWNGDESQLPTRDGYDALTTREQVDYDRWSNGFPPKFGGWKRPKIDPPRKRDVARELAEDVARGERIATATPSPSQNGGSNAEPAETLEEGVSDGADAG